jgi:hypothetical protein
MHVYICMIRSMRLWVTRTHHDGKEAHDHVAPREDLASHSILAFIDDKPRTKPQTECICAYEAAHDYAEADAVDACSFQP